MDEPNRYASREELRFARVLEIGVRIALLALVVSFALYVSGVLPPLVPLSELPSYWSLPVHEFVRATHTPTGWQWLALLDKGDILNLLPIAVMGTLAGVCCLGVLPLYLRDRDRLAAYIVVAQIVVLIVAASNLFGTR